MCEPCRGTCFFHEDKGPDALCSRREGVWNAVCGTAGGRGPLMASHRAQVYLLAHGDVCGGTHRACLPVGPPRSVGKGGSLPLPPRLTDAGLLPGCGDGSGTSWDGALCQGHPGLVASSLEPWLRPGLLPRLLMTRVFTGGGSWGSPHLPWGLPWDRQCASRPSHGFPSHLPSSLEAGASLPPISHMSTLIACRVGAHRTHREAVAGPAVAAPAPHGLRAGSAPHAVIFRLVLQVSPPTYSQDKRCLLRGGTTAEKLLCPGPNPASFPEPTLDVLACAGAGGTVLGGVRPENHTPGPRPSEGSGCLQQTPAQGLGFAAPWCPVT